MMFLSYIFFRPIAILKMRKVPSSVAITVEEKDKLEETFIWRISVSWKKLIEKSHL